jgi:hypothetical protein
MKAIHPSLDRKVVKKENSLWNWRKREKAFPIWGGGVSAKGFDMEWKERQSLGLHI